MSSERRDVVRAIIVTAVVVVVAICAGLSMVGGNGPGLAAHATDAGSGRVAGSEYVFRKDRGSERYAAVFTPPLQNDVQLLSAMLRLTSEAYGDGVLADVKLGNAKVGAVTAVTLPGKGAFTYYYVPARGRDGETLGMAFWRSH